MIKHYNSQNEEIAIIDKNGELHLFIKDESRWDMFFSMADVLTEEIIANGRPWEISGEKNIPWTNNRRDKLFPITACDGDLLLWCELHELPIKIANGYVRFERWVQWKQ